MAFIVIVLQVLLALGFFAASIPKVLSMKPSLVNRDHLKVTS